MNRPNIASTLVKPSGSLLFWLVLLIVQVGTWAPLVLFGVETHQNAIGRAITSVLAFVWILVPFGGLYGAHLGVRSLAQRPGNILAWTGIVFNSLYIAFGVLYVSIVAMGITA
jgi:succinate dehydrogenase/fumarate reductase cytochrome b subunit